jgi:hypothetical protein
MANWAIQHTDYSASWRTAEWMILAGLDAFVAGGLVAVLLARQLLLALEKGREP